ncbi:MAG TPA: platelet-activating factor acetylhydrolase IB subunit [Verrucomicrobiota bacterium]|nr:hypothetical protein [Verrucomicrobiales bacterium]HRI12336.1 platelet-activating factor acetylhydrolase IB subunit [Verrucomicrobiota bacterium]
MRLTSTPIVLATLWAIASGISGLAHSANEPAPRTEEWWKKRQELLNQRAEEAGEKAEIIFIGDSITQGWEGEGKDIWAKTYAPRNAVNLGIGGDRTQHVLWRLANGNLKGLKPKAAVVMIGTNNSNGDDNSVEQIADGVKAIVDKLRSSLPDTKILLLAIFPRSENPSVQRGKVLQVNQVIQKLADNRSVFWIDFGSKFVTAEALIPRDLMPDYLHLSPAGYQIWADSIEPTLTDIIGGKTAANSATSQNLTGKWTFTIPGPGGEPVSMKMILEQSGEHISGKFERPDGNWLNVESGKSNGAEFSWTVKRDRTDGSVMTYQMKGKWAGNPGNQISGEVVTIMDGSSVTSGWTAKRD